ncbi:RNA polymerase sigma-70 factor [Cytophagaceae bacterium YF14B1]|uniref:RNA polymerase sigma-70 factor n=1 Tax=Xanthocytophaga flava TaxID=3048013 RepID=A0AAE3U8I1_9BACT|nr:RNA polymerase sigma-70 factor [Xanthocytophaga flavus]MDJ1480709.1 RNA polymerase sigma-70 factor [Xanthocytophaga flavus]
MSYLSADEEELLRELRAGNEKAFNEIYDRYWKNLYLFARNKLRSEDEALDITQDIFVKLWTKRDTLLITTSLSGYLFKSLKNKILDHIDATYTREDYLASLKNMTPSFRESTAEKVAESEIYSLLDTSLASMPSRMKEIFELSRRQDHSIAEISQQLDLSQQTVKNQLTSALRRLRLSLSDYIVSILLFCLWIS